MSERRSVQGVEHLQAAARELLGAARAFLDVVEEVVEDPERLSGAAAAVSDLVRDGLGVTRRQPWEEAAWDSESSEAETAESAGSATAEWEPSDWYDVDESEDDAVPEEDAAPADDAPAAPTQRPKRTTSRVRRISVD